MKKRYCLVKEIVVNIIEPQKKKNSVGYVPNLNFTI